MNAYKLRTDGISDDLVHSLSHDAERVLYARERGSDGLNLHYHWYITTNAKSPALRARIRKHGFVGNGSYSLKKLDEATPIEYIAYVLKEGDYVAVKGIEPELVTQATEYDKSVKADMAKTKKSKMSRLDDIRASMPSGLFEHTGVTSSHIGNIDRKRLTRYVLEYHRDNNLLIRKFQVISYVDTILAEQDTGIDYLVSEYCDGRF